MSHDVNDVQLVEGEATSHDVGESVNCNLDPSFAMADVVCIYVYFARSTQLWLWLSVWQKDVFLGGGFKHVLFSPLRGEMIQFD